ncbi:MAG: substrate-binding domain-containing protein [Cyanobacteria bacterium SBLK]|nr:substrate-binding domain-containing protein [Cyanobacteria bacterium SBLK]
MRRRNRFYYLILIGFAIACTDRVEEIAPDPSPSEITSHSADIPSLVEEPQATLSPFKEQGSGKIRLPEINPLDIRENFSIAGSSTVHPLVQVMYDRFIEEGYQGEALLENITSNSGFKLFCQTVESDIVSADRPIRDDEMQACSQRDRTPISFRIGTDAIVVAVHPDNDFIENLSFAELAGVFTAEKWSDINPNWPKKTIERFIPSRDSGTLSVFVDRIFQGRSREILNAPNTTENDEEEILAQSVSLDIYSVSFFSYAYYLDYAETLKLIAVEGIPANPQTVKNANYPLIRPLFLYSDAKIMQEKSQVSDFINFFLTNINEEIGKVGYFPDNADTLDEAESNWLKAIGKNKKR